jgi:hypothetical protein
MRVVPFYTVFSAEDITFNRSYVGLFSPKLQSYNWYNTDIICISNSPNTVVTMRITSFDIEKFPFCPQSAFMDFM